MEFFTEMFSRSRSEEVERYRNALVFIESLIRPTGPASASGRPISLAPCARRRAADSPERGFASPETAT